MADRSTESRSNESQSAVKVREDVQTANRVEIARERLEKAAARIEERYREVGRHGRKQAAPSSVAEVETEIDELYDRIILLSDEATVDPTASEDQIEALLVRLLKVQAVEAESFRRRFEASLEMPIDAGEQLLARAQSLREELEDSAARTAAAGSADTP